MMRVVVALLLSTLLSCARHHVILRDQGRVDSAKSIASTSDEAWQVLSEPSRDESP